MSNKYVKYSQNQISNDLPKNCSFRVLSMSVHWNFKISVVEDKNLESLLTFLFLSYTVFTHQQNLSAPPLENIQDPPSYAIHCYQLSLNHRHLSPE